MRLILFSLLYYHHQRYGFLIEWKKKNLPHPIVVVGTSCSIVIGRGDDSTLSSNVDVGDEFLVHTIVEVLVESWTWGSVEVEVLAGVFPDGEKAPGDTILTSSFHEHFVEIVDWLPAATLSLTLGLINPIVSAISFILVCDCAVLRKCRAQKNSSDQIYPNSLSH